MTKKLTSKQRARKARAAKVRREKVEKAKVKAAEGSPRKGKLVRMVAPDDTWGGIGIAGRKKEYRPDDNGVYHIDPADVTVCLRVGLKVKEAEK